jgi:GNAT superfamily N-acetyltransferase
MGELGVPFAEEFDGHDYGATHVIACLGDEPIGAVRVRWFKSFAMTDRLAVLPRFRGHGVGQQLLEHCRIMAQGRGCATLCAQVLPLDSAYLEKLGWRRAAPDARIDTPPNRIVALIKPVDSKDTARHLHEIVTLTVQ